MPSKKSAVRIATRSTYLLVLVPLVFGGLFWAFNMTMQPSKAPSAGNGEDSIHDLARLGEARSGWGRMVITSTFQ